MTTRPVLHPVKMFLAAIVVAFIAATATTGAAATSSADGDSSNVVQAKKEYRTTDPATAVAPLKKEW